MPNSQHSFFQDVWDVVRQIPRGRVTSYGAIGKYLGTGKSARMVGWAMNTCPPDVPAQRVVNAQGLLTGRHHFHPDSPMDALLEAEGTEVRENQVVRFQELFWDPNSLDAEMD